MISSMLFAIAAQAVIGFYLFKYGIVLSKKIGFVDHPSSRRRHPEPMPITGGAVVLMTFFLGFALYIFQNPQWFAESRLSILILLSHATVLCVVGLIDDIKGLSPTIKLTLELTLAITTIMFVPEIHSFIDQFTDRIGIFSWVIATLWIVGICNAINLVDGLDGLAGGISVLLICSISLLSLKWNGMNHIGFLMSVFLLVPMLIFLKFNWNPAKVFLGDNGSLPMGYLLATLSLTGPIQSKSWTQIATLILMMGYPILDMGLCVYRRLRTKNPIFKADRNHLHHRLLRLGFTPVQVVVVVLGLTAYLQVTTFCLIDLLRANAIRSDIGLFRTSFLILIASFISFFSLLYLLRVIENRIVLDIATSKSNEMNPHQQLKNDLGFKDIFVVKIALDPLFESAMFEEKTRSSAILTSLRLLCESIVGNANQVYIIGSTLHIVLLDRPATEETKYKFEKEFEEKLTSFRNLYNIQYSTADLSFSFEKQEFLVQTNQVVSLL